MFGDILSDLAGGLVGGMGMAACAEIGDETGLFQPAHGSAPDIMGQDKANPLAAILSGALMLDYLAEKLDRPSLSSAAELIEAAVFRGFSENIIRPMEYGGDLGTRAVTNEIIKLVNTSNLTDWIGRDQPGIAFATPCAYLADIASATNPLLFNTVKEDCVWINPRPNNRHPEKSFFLISFAPEYFRYAFEPGF